MKNNFMKQAEVEPPVRKGFLRRQQFLPIPFAEVNWHLWYTPNFMFLKKGELMAYHEVYDDIPLGFQVGS